MWNVWAILVMVCFGFTPSLTDQDSEMFTLSSYFESVSKTRSFVDKTMLLKAIHEAPKINIITAPNRFGKSTNLDMMRVYFSIPPDEATAAERKRLFQGLRIYKEAPKFFQDTFGKYLVLYLDFTARKKVYKYRDCIRFLGEIILAQYKLHPYLVNSTKLNEDEKENFHYWIRGEKLRKDNVRPGLRNLIEYLYKHHGKRIFLMIDNYEGFINKVTLFSEAESDDEVNYVMKIITGRIESMIRRDEYMEKVVLTGQSTKTFFALPKYNKVLPIQDKFHVFEFLKDHPFSDFYGMTQVEVDQLLDKFDLKDANKEVGEWYGGYTTKRGQFFNFHSIGNFLQERTIRSFWRTSNLTYFPSRMCRFRSIKDDMFSILRNQPVKIELSDKVWNKEMIALYIATDIREVSHKVEEPFYQLLSDWGYLNYQNKSLQITNREVRDALLEGIIMYYVTFCKLNHEPRVFCADFLNHFNIETQTTNETFKTQVKSFQVNLGNVGKSLRQNCRYGIKVASRVLSDFAFILTSHLNYFHTIVQTYDEHKYSNDYATTDVFITRGNFAAIIHIAYVGVDKPDSKVCLQHILDHQYYNIYKNTSFTKHKITHELFIGISISEQASISLSCLPNSRNMLEAIVFPQ